MDLPRIRVLYLLRNYPLVCETYIQAEIDALGSRYEVRVASQHALGDALEYAENPAPWRIVKRIEDVHDEVRRFKPHALHMHWLLDAALLLTVARHHSLPFTVRAHSFDTLPSPYMARWFQEAPQALREMARDPLCRGILAFPFSRPFLENCGVPPEKIHDCRPPVDVRRFLDRTPNGEGMLNVGACLPKKDLGQYVELAARFPSMRFDLYPVGYDTRSIEALNQSRGSPVRIHRCVRHREMPAVYKAHQWLVYTASHELRNVGWPVAVAEAQASGCGVAMANLRPDLRDFVGEEAILFDRLDDLAGIIDRPVPPAMREAGFAKAMESDVDAQIDGLTGLWPATAVTTEGGLPTPR
jgi:glycosyltransferase involved in cell wall biosynthesis